MIRTPQLQKLTYLGAALLAVSLLLAAGCGSSGDNKCSGVQCDFGKCNPSTGNCTNRDSCNVSADCIPGYECADGSCEALSECSSDGDCDAGVCRNSACVNPSSCSSNSDCLPRTYCDTSGDGGTCKPDPCNEKSCPRGVCKRGTDQCVSADSCTKENEKFNCISGEKCLVTDDSGTGTCKDEENFCSSVDCGNNGVCKFSEGGCADAADCKGMDSRCTEGNFCNDQNRCQADLCAQNDVQCDQGTCIPTTGQCENAENCSSSDDCVAGHLCVDGTCRLESAACGDAGGDGGCPGNQTCEYDSEKLTASCAEPDVCETSFDCTDNRQCGGRVCLDPQMCTGDRFEKNNKKGNATVFHEVARQNAVRASICSGDTDFYKVNTAEIHKPGIDGTIVVRVDVADRAQGLGKLNLRLIGKEGNELGSTSTGALGAEGSAEIATELGVPDLGELTVEVSAGDDVKQPGVNYRLSANIHPNQTVNTCKNATAIKVNQRVSGTTEGAESNALDASCASDATNTTERIYKLDVDSPQELTFELNPQLSSADFTMSLRRNCTDLSTEIACTDETNAGGSETLTALVDRGTYYLVVQPPSPSAGGGPFELNTDRVFTACSSRGDYCDAEGNAHTCTVDGGRFQEVECDAGCNPTTGFCNPPAGDICGTANTIDPMNAGQRTLTLNQVTNQYEISAGTDSCLGTTEANTGGPDQTYEVKIPDQKAFTATVNFDNEIEGSLALVSDCSDAGTTCEKGAVGSTDSKFKEELTQVNKSGLDESYYLIVDTAAGQEVSTATLDIQYQDIVCTPDAKRCNGGSVEQCNEFGTAWEGLQSCNGAFGCSNGGCVADTCTSAYNATSDVNQSGGASYTVTWDEYKNDFEASDVCPNADTLISSTDTSGKESVYQIDLNAGERLTATVSGDDDATVFLKSAGNCNTANSPCLDVFEDEDPGTVEYLAQSQETVYLTVDRDDPSASSYTLDMSVEQADCTPSSYSPTCTATFERRFCSPLGRETTENCPFGCSSGACDAEKTCSSPLNITSEASASGGITFNQLDWGDYSGEQNGSGCGVRTSDTDGPELVWEVDLQSGEQLTADVTNNGSGYTYEAVFILGNCTLSSSTCKSGETGFDTPVSASYTASSNETVYVLVEADTSFNVDGDTFDININVQ